MMTVKIIAHESDGGTTTHIFPATRISHKEYVLNDNNTPNETFDQHVRRQNPEHVVSGLGNQNTSQNMRVSCIMLHDNSGISPLLVSAPAACYIMSEGKTIDQFTLNFID